ncbi:MAG TPA: VWA domain-containing protein [Phycisphaerales bacterium]|nr:VWA domain-containing protein [Phycisphaerales bacterium]HMP35918.1 VWA domain-containing protein [Phycisphaerales bacterium]
MSTRSLLRSRSRSASCSGTDRPATPRSLSAVAAALAATTALVAVGCPPSIDDPSIKAPSKPSSVALASIAERPIVELAICLDTSNSMDRLIDAARARLWDVVNELALAVPAPTVRVGIVSFGNNAHAAADGWVKLELDLTDDLDAVSMRLFGLRTHGGTEYVGRALAVAESKLSWTRPSESGGAEGGAAPPLLQMVIVAGNESADQDREVCFREAARSLVGRGITVNSIYCGPERDSVAPGWREIASIADGHFAAIDQSSGVLAATTPFDADLAKLGTEINSTYLAFGARGSQAAANQSAQDANTAQMGPTVMAGRSLAKAGELYDCAAWDLVDACQNPDFKLESVAVEDLPEPMRAMTPTQRADHVAALTAQRAELRAQIAKLGDERSRHLAERRREAQGAGEKSFITAILQAVRAQGTAKGLAWKVEE